MRVAATCGEDEGRLGIATEPTELMCLSKDTFESLLGPMQKLIDREVAKRDKEIKEKAEPRILWSDLDVRTILDWHAAQRERLRERRIAIDHERRRVGDVEEHALVVRDQLARSVLASSRRVPACDALGDTRHALLHHGSEGRPAARD